ncbi:hypothetical protein YC2023_062528 [Brassica napus]
MLAHTSKKLMNELIALARNLRNYQNRACSKKCKLCFKQNQNRASLLTDEVRLVEEDNRGKSSTLVKEQTQMGGNWKAVSWTTRPNRLRSETYSERARASSIELRESLLEPHRYPELKSLIERILLLFSRLDSWSLVHVQGSKNRVSTAIAESVIANFRTQSYVATEGHSWLSHTISPKHKLCD